MISVNDNVIVVNINSYWYKDQGEVISIKFDTCTKKDIATVNLKGYGKEVIFPVTNLRIPFDYEINFYSKHVKKYKFPIKTGE